MLDELIVVTEELDDKELSFSLLGVAIKMDLNMGETQAGPGVARGVELISGLSFPNSMLHFREREGAVEAGMLTDGST